MLHSLRIARSHPYLPLFLQTPPLGRKTASPISFQQVKCGSTQPDHNNQDKKKNMDQSQSVNPNEKSGGDVMSHSFGEGYSTRSDEEGFGGVYGENQTLKKLDEVKEIHENHHAYDKSQGSDVKEKEEARNRPSVT